MLYDTPFNLTNFAPTMSHKHCQLQENNANIVGRQIFLQFFSIYLNCIICVTALFDRARGSKD